MPSSVSYNQVDYSNEATHTKFYIQTLDATTFVAGTAFANAIRAAIAAISLCNEKDMTATAILHSSTGTPPTNVNAQRELLIRVFYKDDTNGRTGTLTIPGPDLTLLTITGDNVLLADGDVMADFVTAFEAGAVSRDQNNVIVTAAIVDGRHS